MHTIYFDFGNVLGRFDHWQSVKALLPYTTLTGPELFAVMYDNPLEESYERADITSAEYIALVTERAGMTCTPAEFAAGFRDIFTRNDEICDAIPKLAARYRLLLASNTNDMHFTHYCGQFAEVLKHFQALPTSHQGRCRKPSAAFFEYAQAYAEAEPRDCLFVDDLAINIAAGQRHGWNVLHYQPGNFAAKMREFCIEF